MDELQKEPVQAIKKLLVAFITLYLLALNWPILNWAFGLSRPPDIQWVLGAPFVVIWGTAWSLVLLMIWVYYQLVVGSAVVKRVSQYTFKNTEKGPEDI